MTNGAPAGVSKSPTGSIAWTDITPDPTSTKTWVALAINSDSSLMAASDGAKFYTSSSQGAAWTSWAGVPTASVAISGSIGIGAGPGVDALGIPASWEGVAYGPVTAAGAKYQTITVAGKTYSATPTVPSPPLSTLITNYAATYQIDPDAFARQLLRESNWCPNAIGGTTPPGEGIAQWTKPYPQMYPALLPLNPDNAIMYAAIYLNYFMGKYYGNLGLAFAAYNSGEGPLNTWLSMGQPNSGPPIVQKGPYAGKSVWDPNYIWAQYVLNLTGRTIWEWAADGFKLIAANAGNSNISVSNNSGAKWFDQLPQPGALPNACVAIGATVSADAVAATGSALWVTRSLTGPPPAR